MEKGIFTFVLFNLFLYSFFANAQEKVSAINFLQEGEISKLEVLIDGKSTIEAERFHISEDKQIVLDLKNVEATDRVLRGFDTSEFSGTVVFVSPYRKPGEAKDIRVAIQLRDNARSFIQRENGKVILLIENRFGAFSQSQIDQLSKKEIVTGTDKAGQQTTVGVTGLINVPKSDTVEDILDNLTLSGRKKYIGKKISVNVKDIPVKDLINMIGDSSGFNVIYDEEVNATPPLSLNLTNIPWDQALDTVMGISKLVARKNGNILIVTTLKKATDEKKTQIESDRLNREQEPLVTKIFPISFAKLEDIEKIVSEYRTPDRGKITLDARTNSLIIRDTVASIDRIKKIVEYLDTQTPQILIESKIVEVTESYAKEIGLRNGLSFGYDPITSISGVADSGPGFSFSSAPLAGSGTFVGLNVSRFKRLIDFSLNLQLMENESKAKIVSSPRVITQNKRKAQLTNTDQTSFTQRAIGQAGSTDIAQAESIEATLDLQVTPQVTNEGSIALEVNIKKEGFGNVASTGRPDKQSRSLSTNVLVDNGSTIVLGGLYTFDKRENHSGIPFLKDIPLVGWLFRSAYNPTEKKTELIIFITPRIINQEEAGLTQRDESQI